MSENIRVRYAPSPTGFLHIGNARTALFNYLFAKHNDGAFIIRIEDTDQSRHVDEGEKSQLDNLKWLGIDWDESVDVPGDVGPYRQSERRHIYDPIVEQLLKEDKAYKCYMTEEELEAEREEQIANGMPPRYSGKHANLTDQEREQFEAEGRTPSIRLRVPQNKTYKFNDMVKGEVSFESNDFGDWVIVKKDGMPTYNFAVAIDDHHMKITHVLRGDDHISNTPKQLMVYDVLGYEPPIFGHMTLIVNENKKKLSKRDGSILQFIEQYRDLGYLPEALFNFITLLGWTPGGEEEIFSKDELIEKFEASRLSKSPAFFDKQKLEWINNQYMKTKDTDTVFEMSMPFLMEAGLVEPSDKEWAYKLVELYQPQMSYAKEIVELSELFFKDELTMNDEAKAVLEVESVPTVLKALKTKLEQLEDFEAAAIKKEIKSIQKETGIKGKNLFMPIRVAVSGQTHGPELPNTIELLGKEKVSKRIDDVLKNV